MPKGNFNTVQAVCNKAIHLLRGAQDIATGLEWRRLQHAISRVALTAGKIRPMLRRRKRKRPNTPKTKID